MYEDVLFQQQSHSSYVSLEVTIYVSQTMNIFLT